MTNTIYLTCEVNKNGETVEMDIPYEVVEIKKHNIPVLSDCLHGLDLEEELAKILIEEIEKHRDIEKEMIRESPEWHKLKKEIEDLKNK